MRRPPPLPIFLLLLVVGLGFAAEGVESRPGPVVCPGENTPWWSHHEEVPGPMSPKDTSCQVISSDGHFGGTRTYQQQKAVQLRQADTHIGIGSLLTLGGGAGIVWIGLSSGRLRARRTRSAVPHSAAQ